MIGLLQSNVKNLKFPKKVQVAMKSVLRRKNVWNVFNLFILLKEILSFDDLHYFEFWMPPTYKCFITFVTISGMFHCLMTPKYSRSFISFN